VPITKRPLAPPSVVGLQENKKKKQKGRCAGTRNRPWPPGFPPGRGAAGGAAACLRLVRPRRPGGYPRHTLGDPKPGPIKIQIDAALRNLSLAACPNKTAELLAVLAPNVTVLFPFSDPLLLNSSAAQEAFSPPPSSPVGCHSLSQTLGWGPGPQFPSPFLPLSPLLLRVLLGMTRQSP